MLNELKYRPVPKLFLEMGISQPFKQDTLILKVEINFSPDKFKKEISVAYSTLEDYHNKYYLKQLSEFKYTDIPTEVSFYIPIILRPETPNNYNKMHRVVINDGCFLIEYETPKPIMPDGW